MSPFAESKATNTEARGPAREGSASRPPTLEDKQEWLAVFMRAVESDLRSTEDYNADAEPLHPTRAQLKKFFASRDPEELEPSSAHDARTRRRRQARFDAIFRAERSASLSERASSERTLGGRYVVERELGRGGSGVVYEVQEVDSKAHLALKLFHHDDALGGGALKADFRQLSELTHPNIVSLYELSFDGEHWCVAMELVDGQRFDDYVQGSTLRLRAALRQLVDGLIALHCSGQLHGDIKPPNVLVTSGGRVVILDVGLARCHKSRLPAERNDWMHGTPAYTAPECANGMRLTAASDWYSVGVMLYEALTGQLPSDEQGASEAKQLLNADALSAQLLSTDSVPKDLAQLCLRMLEPDPGRRIEASEICRRLHGGRPPAPPMRNAMARAFIGRSKPLERLHAAFQNVSSGKTNVVFVGGNSGSGKSALLEQFVERLETEAIVLRIRCSERESIPYKILDDVVDATRMQLQRLLESQFVQTDWVGRAKQAQADTELARAVLALQRMHMQLAHAVTRSEKSALTTPVTRTLQSIWGLLSAYGTLVISIDDLQWGDAPSAKLLRAIFADPDTPPLLFVGSFRSENSNTSACLRCIRKYLSLRSQDVATAEIGLTPMSDSEASELARELMRKRATSALAFDRNIERESGGMPFLLAKAAELARSSARPAWPAKRISLSVLMLWCIDRLSDAARRVLEVVCIAAGPIEQGDALALSGLATGDRAVLQELRAERLVQTSGPRLSDLVQPYHQSIREIVVRELPRVRREQLQRQLANARSDKS